MLRIFTNNLKICSSFPGKKKKRLQKRRGPSVLVHYHNGCVMYLRGQVEMAWDYLTVISSENDSINQTLHTICQDGNVKQREENKGIQTLMIQQNNMLKIMVFCFVQIELTCRKIIHYKGRDIITGILGLCLKNQLYRITHRYI